MSVSPSDEVTLCTTNVKLDKVRVDVGSDGAESNLALELLSAMSSRLVGLENHQGRKRRVSRTRMVFTFTMDPIGRWCMNSGSPRDWGLMVSGPIEYRYTGWLT